jgi:hypothetical protein
MTYDRINTMNQQNILNAIPMLVAPIDSMDPMDTIDNRKPKVTCIPLSAAFFNQLKIIFSE